MPAHALTKAETMSLSYGQVKGSGLANRCPSVVGEETIALSSGKQYKITDLCLEPKSWQVKQLFFDFIEIKLHSRRHAFSFSCLFLSLPCSE